MFVNAVDSGVRQHQQSVPDVRRFGSDLLNQQMWCWGSDIRRPAGNLLRDYGFIKHAAPEGSGLKPCYSLEAGGVSIRLWGFGLFFAVCPDYALFLKRFEFVPRLVDPAAMTWDVWRTRDLPRLWSPGTDAEVGRSHELLSESCAWIASYERWVQARAGSAWRASTVGSWRGMRKRVVADGDEMAGRWSDLSRHFLMASPAPTGGA